jgi:predicted metal-dependent enzyme (double-stranded beta helix superfamily)
LSRAGLAWGALGENVVMTTQLLDLPVRELLERIAEPAAAATPDLPAIGAALTDLVADTSYLAPWIERLDGGSGAVAIHAPERGPRLTLVHRLEGQMSAVHDHGTWVAISPIRGIETHRRWRRLEEEGGPPRIELAEDRALDRADVATLLPPDDVHDHGHLVGRGNPAYILILLGDAQVRYRRNEWDLATGRHRILEPGDGGRWLATEPWPGA